MREETDAKRIEEFLAALKVGEPATTEDFRRELRANIGDRGLTVYLMWKVLEERCPELDAKGLMAEACRRFGQLKSKGIRAAAESAHAGESTKVGDGATGPTGTARVTAADWMKGGSSRSGVLAWDQRFEQLNEERAVKVFGHCPHIAAAKAAGATDDELAQLCRDIMIHADYGMAAAFPHLELDFPGKTCAEGGNCRMVIAYRKE